MLHALDRAIIHFFSASGVCLLSFFVLHWIQRRKQWPWLPSLVQPQLLFVAVCVFAGTALREAWDVAQGQSFWKACSDYSSWFLGCSAAVWGLWRFRST